MYIKENQALKNISTYNYVPSGIQFAISLIASITCNMLTASSVIAMLTSIFHWFNGFDLTLIRRYIPVKWRKAAIKKKLKKMGKKAF